MILRRLNRDDAAAYADIRLESLRESPDAYGSTLADWEHAPLSAFAERTDTSFVVGAFDGATLCGISVLDREKGGNTRHRALITAVFVRSGLRGNGIAVAMVNHLAEVARDAGALQVELNVLVTNAPAVRAYESAGFVVAGVHPRAILSRGTFFDELLMIRHLDV